MPSDPRCCPLRFKIVFSMGIVPEEHCGIPDSDLADVSTFDKSQRGRPIVAFRFCPWCGKPWVLTGDIQESAEAPDEGSGEEWKKGGET